MGPDVEVDGDGDWTEGNSSLPSVSSVVQRQNIQAATPPVTEVGHGVEGDGDDDGDWTDGSSYLPSVSSVVQRQIFTPLLHSSPRQGLTLRLTVTVTMSIEALAAVQTVSDDDGDEDC